MRALILAFALTLVPAIAAAQDHTVSRVDEAFTCPGGTFCSGGGNFNWQWQHDTGTPGTASATSTTGSGFPNLDGLSRQFVSTTASGGGLLTHADLGDVNDSPNATRFVYDIWYFYTDVSQWAQFEFDVNHPLNPAGKKTVTVSGTQCNSANGKEQWSNYTGGGHWVSSTIPCTKPPTNTWVHRVIASTQDGAGNAIYNWLAVGAQGSPLVQNSYNSGTVFTAFFPASGWRTNSQVINYQNDQNGSGGGTNYVTTMYIDQMQIFVSNGGDCPTGANYTDGKSLTLQTLTNLGVYSCYYIAATGLDTNTCADEAHPCQHAPGMPNCTATCAAITPSPGEGFIFRGGDVWNYGVNVGAATGGAWVWQWSGSVDGTSTNPIYLGADLGWFKNTSYLRPVFSGDNPLNTTFVASCAHDNAGLAAYLTLSAGVTYVNLDELEFSGSCWGSGMGPDAIQLASSSTQFINITRSYFHDWSTVASTTDGVYAVAGFGNETQDHNVFAYNVVDGFDSSAAPANSPNCQLLSGAPCYSGGGISQAMGDIHGNVFHHLSDAVNSSNTLTFHDNYVSDLAPTYQAGGHSSNVLNEIASVPGQNQSIYNNLITHIHIPQAISLAVSTGQSAYVFNNVLWDMLNTGVAAVGANCIKMNTTHAGSSTAFFTNNTFDYGDGQFGGTHTGACQVNGAGTNVTTYSTAWNGTVTFQNNHFINYQLVNGSPTIANAVTLCSGGVSCTFTDAGNEVFQSEAAANGQGYTQGNNYAPTAGTNATIAQGFNLTTSCATYSADSALCYGTSSGVTSTAGNVSYPAVPLLLRPAPLIPANNGLWDSGAYYMGGAGPPGPTSTPQQPSGGSLLSLLGIPLEATP